MPAQLRSNDGASVLVLGLEERANYATEAGFESSIHIAGRHWDGDHTHQIDVSMPGIWLRKGDLLELRETLATWAVRPLHELTPAFLSGEFQLARLPGQSVLIRFGPRRDVDDRRNPVVTIALAAGSLAVAFHFSTDHSCLDAFRHHIDAALDEAG